MKYKVIPNGLKKRPRGSFYEDDPEMGMMFNLTVFEEELGPEFTGILDQSGDPIYRIPHKFKIGFDIGTEEDEDYYE